MKLRALALFALLSLGFVARGHIPVLARQEPINVPVAAPPVSDTTNTMGLPPLPNHVESQIGPVKVLRVKHLVCGTVEALGCFIGNQHVIYVRLGSPRNVEWQTLEHEKVHAILWVSGYTSKMPEGLEDGIADAIGAARVQEMLVRVRADTTHTK